MAGASRHDLRGLRSVPPPGHESAGVLERLFTEPADLVERSDGDSVVGKDLLRRWLLPAGYRQPVVASAMFVAAILLAIGLGLAIAFVIRDSGLTDAMLPETLPASRRAWAISPSGPDCVLGTLDFLLVMFRSCRGWSSVGHVGNARKRWSRIYPFHLTFWPRSAEPVLASMLPCRVSSIW